MSTLAGLVAVDAAAAAALVVDGSWRAMTLTPANKNENGKKKNKKKTLLN